MEMGPLIVGVAVLYFVGIDWVVSKAERGRSNSRRGCTPCANKLLGKLFGKELVYGCCNRRYTLKVI